LPEIRNVPQWVVIGPAARRVLSRAGQSLEYLVDRPV
jgi:hypothetical protein